MGNEKSANPDHKNLILLTKSLGIAKIGACDPLMTLAGSAYTCCFERRCHNLSDCPYFLLFVFSCNNLHADGSSIVDIWIISLPVFTVILIERPIAFIDNVDVFVCCRDGNNADTVVQQIDTLRVGGVIVLSRNDRCMGSYRHNHRIYYLSILSYRRIPIVRVSGLIMSALDGEVLICQ